MPRQIIKAVIIAAFEPDDEPGSGFVPVPGELTHWIEREHLTHRLQLPAAYRPLWSNEAGVLALATGVGGSRAAASMMALGLDPRFDLTQAWFLITGVAGIDPARGSLGSVVLPKYVVDGSLAHEIDAREIPVDDVKWPDGFVPIGKTLPYEQPHAQRFHGDDGIVFPLNGALSEWAFRTARRVELEDTAGMAARRVQFSPAPTAQRPPFLLRGSELASSTFWHGRLMSARAQRWVAYQTAGFGWYAMTAMEDAGILQALTFLAQGGNLDLERVLIARAASNYDQQRDGIAAAESLAETRVVSYSAYRPALENACRVGRVLLAGLMETWPLPPSYSPT